MDTKIEELYERWCDDNEVARNKETRLAFDAGYNIGHLDATVEAMMGIAKYMANQVEHEVKQKQEARVVTTTAA